MIKRFDRVDVATSDLDDAASIYEKNFGFKVNRSGEHASVTIGGAEIRLASGASAADAIKANGEGMFGVWLEADDVDLVVASLKKAGFGTRRSKRSGADESSRSIRRSPTRFRCLFSIAKV